MSNNSSLGGYHAKLIGKKTLINIVSIFLCIISILPFWLLFVNATRTNLQITSGGLSLIPGKHLFENLNNVLNAGTFKATKGMLNSFIISASTTFLTVFFATLTAYGLSVYNFKLKNAAFTFILAILMIPTQVSAVGYLQFLYNVGLNDTYAALILPAIAAPSAVFFMKQYMKATFPLDIVEAARIDGSSEIRTFVQIALPIMKPAIATQAIFAFISSWNNFFTPSMVLTSMEKYTLPMMISLLKGQTFLTDYGMIYAGIFFSIVPLIIVYVCLSKYIIQGVALGGVKE